MSKIKELKAREILDSRGFPTVEVDIILESNIVGRAAVPSGASTGKKEALELRDNDKARYCGKGVLKAIDSVNLIAKRIIGLDCINFHEIDQLMIDLDGTDNKHNLGANAILAISMANVKAAAIFHNMPLCKFLEPRKNYTLPVPLMNIINGGAHADNGIDIQEFMIAPVGADSISEAVRIGAEIFQNLKIILKDNNLNTNVGDEGGFAPNIKNAEEAIILIIKAVEKAGYRIGEDILLALDVAASELYDGDKYRFKRSNLVYSDDELIEFYKNMISKYPIFSIEDPLSEEDHEGWKKITKILGNKIQLVGDDVFVTNPEIFSNGIKDQIANSILIKPNQIGSLKETYSTICIARENRYNTIMSHRSGETTDTTISHLAVAYDCKQIKTGSLCRSDRVAKYNELMRIEEYFGTDSIYAGKNILKRFC